jgi:hypothetical protein
MKVYEDIIQLSNEWFDLKKGTVSASSMDKIVTPTGKKSTGKAVTAYMRKLARECVLSDPQEFTGNKHTEWGIMYESLAREKFTEETGIVVHEVGFCNREDGAPVGCSPDGLIKIGDIWVQGIEIKCPSVDVHVGYVMDGILPAAHKVQVHGSMAVTGLNHWWFMSYFPGLNPLITRVDRDEFTELVSGALDDFIIEYKAERELVLKAITPTN